MQAACLCSVRAISDARNETCGFYRAGRISAENLGAGLASGPIAALWFSLKHDNSECMHHIEIVVEIIPAPADFGSG
jgi:hypothetical protein